MRENENRLAEALRKLIGVADGQVGADVVDDWCPKARKVLSEYDANESRAQPASAADNLSRAAELVAYFSREYGRYYNACEIADVEMNRNQIECGELIPLYAHPSEDARDKKCMWVEDDEGNWDTECEHKHILIEGTPYDNEMGFCCYCGHRIDQALYAHAAMNGGDDV